MAWFLYLGTFGVPCDIVATAAWRALTTFDEHVSRASTRRFLTDIHFINIQRDVTRCMIGVFRSMLQVSLPGIDTDSCAEKYRLP